MGLRTVQRDCAACDTHGSADLWFRALSQTPVYTVRPRGYAANVWHGVTPYSLHLPTEDSQAELIWVVDYAYRVSFLSREMSPIYWREPRSMSLPLWKDTRHVSWDDSITEMRLRLALRGGFRSRHTALFHQIGSQTQKTQKTNKH